jgi:predicted membrane protein
MRRCARFAIVFASLVVGPSAAYAQAFIVGVVRDTSGAVLPGVTVEAASPALIEKVRSVTVIGRMMTQGAEVSPVDQQKLIDYLDGLTK